MFKKFSILAALVLVLGVTSAHAGKYDSKFYIPGLKGSSSVDTSGNGGAVVPTGVPVTWNVTNGFVSYDLLTISTDSNGWKTIYTTGELTSGTAYWEITMPTGGSGGLYHKEGIYAANGTAGFSLVGTPEAYSSGTVLLNGSFYSPTFRAGDVFSYALDVASGTLKVAQNCTWLNNGAVVYKNIVAPVKPSMELVFATHGGYSANFGQKPFTCPVPSGYTPGFYALP